MTPKEALFTYCLRIADNSLILGHRLSELCSKGPILEEDLALTNISLDLIGRTESILTYAAALENKGNSADDLAYRRSEKGYFNHLICEQPNQDFAHTIARQFLVSAFEYYFFTELIKSKDEVLSSIASKSIKEVSYHLRHSSDWIIRLGDGTEESKKRIQNSINDLRMFTGELFEMDLIDNDLLELKLSVDVSSIKPLWDLKVAEVLKEATLSMPEDHYMQTGSRKGIHSEHLGHILSEMQYLQRAYPDAKW